MTRHHKCHLQLEDLYLHLRSDLGERTYFNSEKRKAGGVHVEDTVRKLIAQ